MYAREAEVYAAYTAYTDYEIGRVIQEVQDMGKLDNTLIIYIDGDNGTSAEGSVYGTFNQLTAYNGIINEPDVKPVLAMNALHYGDWGSDKTYPHMSVAWSWAFDTPFKWTKQVASHFGGTRQGLAISWPGHIKDVGGIRTQFHHVIDIVPTILEAAGIQAPDMVNGIKQKPIEGVSMLYTFDSANANAPSKRDTQYFEMVGNRAIYHDGWIAATTPPSPPWELGTGTMPPMNEYKWELYNIAQDYSESNDLAASNPDKLKEMQALFLTEAGKYQVFPLDNSGFVRLLAPKPSAIAGRDRFHLHRRESRHSCRQRSQHSGPGLHHHRQRHDPCWWRGGSDRDDGRPLRWLCAHAKSERKLVAQQQTVQAHRTGFVDSRIASDLHWHSRQVEKTFRLRIRCWSRPSDSFYLSPPTCSTSAEAGRYSFTTSWTWSASAGEGLSSLDEGKHTIVFDFKYDGPGPAKGGTGVLERGWQGGRPQDDRAHHSAAHVDRRDLRHRARHPHARGLHL